MALSTAAQVDEAFRRVDQFLAVAGEVAPSVELLLARAQEQGITEAAMLRHLRLSSTTARWILKLEPATADRIDLGEDLGALLLKWARAA
jgi:hypothetical protein